MGNKMQCTSGASWYCSALAWIGLLVLLAVVWSGPLTAAERVALVIGNSAYTAVPRLE